MSRDYSPAQIAQLLQSTDLFSSVERHILERLASQAGIVYAPAGSILIKQGEMGDVAYLLLEGTVEIVVEFETLGPIRIGEARPVDIIGETGALCHSPRSTNVIARQNVTMLSIEQAALKSITAHHPEFALAILRIMGERLHRVGRGLACLISAAHALREGAASIEAVTAALRSDDDFAPYAKAIEVVAGQIARNEALRQEMEAAARIQQSILPRTMAWKGTRPFAEIAASMRPAWHVGGDFYDYFIVDERRLAVVVGDVSGKGVPAALFMALARNAFRMVARSEASPARVLTKVNRALCEGNDDLLFLTVFYATLDRLTGDLTYGIGGHEAPLLLRCCGDLSTLRLTEDPALGVEESLEFTEERVLLDPDDLLLVYTDGVTEAQDGAAAFFGRERLLALVRSAEGRSAQNLIQLVNGGIDAFASGCAQADDVTCLALRLIDPPAAGSVSADRPNAFVLELASDVTKLIRLATALRRFGSEHGLAPAAINDFVLALDELVGNVMVHGYAKGEAGMIEVKVELDRGWLTATVRDAAPPFDPLIGPAPDITLPLEERKIGGLGVHLARTLTDEIRYQYKSGKNVLTVRKRVNPLVPD